MQSSAHYEAEAIHAIVEKYVMDHPGACPTMQQLKDEKELSSSSKITDPWDTVYKISCKGSDIEVRSFGPDGKEGTADDIIDTTAVLK